MAEKREVADREVALRVARQIAARNAGLMRRLAAGPASDRQ